MMTNHEKKPTSPLSQEVRSGETYLDKERGKQKKDLGKNGKSREMGYLGERSHPYYNYDR
jgi:hypothetical protein